MPSSKNINGNGMTEKIKDQGITQQQPHKEEDDKQRDTEDQDARQDEHKCKDNEICHSISETCNHKLRMETKVTYPSGA